MIEAFCVCLCSSWGGQAIRPVDTIMYSPVWPQVDLRCGISCCFNSEINSDFVVLLRIDQIWCLSVAYRWMMKTIKSINFHLLQPSVCRHTLTFLSSNFSVQLDSTDNSVHLSAHNTSPRLLSRSYRCCSISLLSIVKSSSTSTMVAAITTTAPTATPQMAAVYLHCFTKIWHYTFSQL